MSLHKPKTEWPTLLHRHLQMSEMYQQHMVWSQYVLEFSNDTHCDYFVQSGMLSSLPQLTLEPIMSWIFRYHRYNSSSFNILPVLSFLYFLQPLISFLVVQSMKHVKEILRNLNIFTNILDVPATNFRHSSSLLRAKYSSWNICILLLEATYSFRNIGALPL